MRGRGRKERESSTGGTLGPATVLRFSPPLAPAANRLHHALLAVEPDEIGAQQQVHAAAPLEGVPQASAAAAPPASAASAPAAATTASLLQRGGPDRARDLLLVDQKPGYTWGSFGNKQIKNVPRVFQVT